MSTVHGNSSGVTFTTPGIVAFCVKHADNRALLEACAEHLAAFCKLLDEHLVLAAAPAAAAQDTDSAVLAYLRVLEQKMMSSQRSTLESCAEAAAARAVATVELTPAASMRLDRLEQHVGTMATDLKQTAGAVARVGTDAERLVTKFDDAMKRRGTAQHKGTEGEEGLCDLLSSRLLLRDGYKVDRVAGQACSCDIAIRREGFPTVRIESKAYSPANRVPRAEVDKFVRDLLLTNDHGIFVSLHSPIAGIGGSLELQQLANGRFAVFAAKNEYDADAIVSMLHVLYKLHAITSSSDDDDNSNSSDMIRLSPESMGRIRTILKDQDQSVSQARTHLKQALALLSNMHLQAIEQVLLGQVEAEALVGPSLTGGRYKCPVESCPLHKTGYKNKADLNKHLKHKHPLPGRQQPS